MKKLVSLVVLATTALFVLGSCDKKEAEKSTPKVSISADASFQDGAAAVTLTLSNKAATDVSVSLEVSTADVTTGYTALTADDLTFDATVVIAAGSTSATAQVTVKENAAKEDGKYEAVIKLAAATGATVATDASAAHITLTVGNAYEDDEPEDNPSPDLGGDA